MNERSTGQKLVGAFVVGGLIGVFANVLLVLLSMVLTGEAANFIAPAMLGILGIVGMVLVLNGTYAKLNEIGGFGAGIMFCGLVDAVAGVFMGGAMEHGGKASEGVKAALKFALAILGTMTVVGSVLGFVLANAHMPGVLALLGDPVASPGPVGFLYAFLMGGLISIVGEAILDFTPIPLPAVILICAGAGMVLAISGNLLVAEALFGGGLAATVVDAGAGAVAGGVVLAVAGTPMRLIIFIAVLVFVVTVGIITGNILLKRAKSAQQ